MVSYSRVAESAHRIGRARHNLDDDALAKAVLLGREDASPVQVVLEADAIEALPHETPLVEDGAVPHEAVTTSDVSRVLWSRVAWFWATGRAVGAAFSNSIGVSPRQKDSITALTLLHSG